MFWGFRGFCGRGASQHYMLKLAGIGTFARFISEVLAVLITAFSWLLHFMVFPVEPISLSIANSI
eukprot:314602-Amphidinium_carterae.1